MSDFIWSICLVLCFCIVLLLIENRQKIVIMKYKSKQHENQQADEN
jgi:hypothetical protein